MKQSAFKKHFRGAWLRFTNNFEVSSREHHTKEEAIDLYQRMNGELLSPEEVEECCVKHSFQFDDEEGINRLVRLAR